ncbi:hypothetical protein [Adhaeretor mobilis]|uniref:Uncharacterized protein n=1 Tax=Adhaeretor mobilis TaxID=1930276 RepID=A0A517MSS8_9BACT|nr:hypothetical protein [Adhaeretor mobilis]QDS97946.1 hypothetical protein HG15A2_12150 [Adhaeretor mobilis]
MELPKIEQPSISAGASSHSPTQEARELFSKPDRDRLLPAGVVGIALAGGLYPLAFVTLVFIHDGPPKMNQGVNVFGSILLGCLFGFFIGCLYAFVVGGLLMMVAVVAAKLLSAQYEKPWLASVLGGCAGLICTMPPISYDARPEPIAFVAMSIAVVMGQIGGAWGAELRRRKLSIQLPTSGGLAHFSLKQMLILTAELSVLFAFLSALQFSNPTYWAILTCGVWLAASTGAWKLWRTYRDRNLTAAKADG